MIVDIEDVRKYIYWENEEGETLPDCQDFVETCFYVSPFNDNGHGIGFSLAEVQENNICSDFLICADDATKDQFLAYCVSIYETVLGNFEKKV